VPFTIDPIGVKVGSAPAGCIVPPSSAKAPAPAADTCDVNFLPGGQNFMTVNLKVGETRTFVARGSTAGTYTWLSNVPDGTKVTQTPVQFIASVKALKPGRSNIAVFFTAATPDANGVRHVADAHIDIIAYKVASLSITPTGDQTLAKPPGSNVFEIDKAFDVSLKLTANGEANDVPAAQNIQLSFDDPDDPTISFVIDPNGGSGDDNASIAAGGRRTGVMWKDDADPSRVSSVSASSDGQKALAFLFCKLEQVCTFPVTFRASTIAGDNYIIKADALTFSEGGDTLFDGVQAKSGTWTVRRKISIAHLFEMQNSVSTTHVMSSDEIAPAFTGDGFTDYIQSPDIRILTAADSPHFLCDIDSPDASETPTQDELTRYNSTDPSIKATAKRQIEDKATNWVDRNQQRCISTKADFAARFVPPGTGISVFGIQKLSPKEDADPATGQTNFYPDGILVSVSLDGATAQVDPDGEWSTSPVLIDHDNQLIFIQAVEANEHLRNLLRRAVALTYLDRADFDDTTTGVLGPGAPTGTIDDVNILRLRGYIKLP
jgi:hypothetical protein